ncbi:hypothetical protein A2U01_0043666 [Trifolium medium]|uniref:Uncharacterized protein n=1 Tax=Trifolium medium TaxID=97028 RepID=A0A392QFI2_9FABA|nr:hypothetical protein [Trifolium medium]
MTSLCYAVIFLDCVFYPQEGNSSHDFHESEICDEVVETGNSGANESSVGETFFYQNTDH